MNRSRAIKLKCLDCAGSPKEVTLCHIFDCPLWQFRFGNSLNNKNFHKRMELAKKQFPKEIEEIRKIYYEYYENIANKELKTYVVKYFGANSRIMYISVGKRS